MPRPNGRHVDSVAFSCCCWCSMHFSLFHGLLVFFFLFRFSQTHLWLHTESMPNIWNWICNQKRREKYRRLGAQVRCWKETEVYTWSQNPMCQMHLQPKHTPAIYAATTELATLFSLQSLVCTTALPAYFARCRRCCHRCRGRFILFSVVAFVLVFFLLNFNSIHLSLSLVVWSLLSYLYLVARLV